MTFEDREHGFEAKFAHDQEQQFRALARRDKMFAVWAAQCLGLTGAAWTGFVHNILTVQGFPQHDAALLRKTAEALTAAGQEPAAHDAPALLGRLGEEALADVHGGNATPIDLAPPA